MFKHRYRIRRYIDRDGDVVQVVERRIFLWYWHKVDKFYNDLASAQRSMNRRADKERLSDLKTIYHGEDM